MLSSNTNANETVSQENRQVQDNTALPFTGEKAWPRCCNTHRPFYYRRAQFHSPLHNTSLGTISVGLLCERPWKTHSYLLLILNLKKGCPNIDISINITKILTPFGFIIYNHCFQLL